MANKFKNNKTGAEKNSLFKGNWAIDTTASNIGGGPSSVTELYHGADIPPGGYVMYSPEGVYTTAIESDLLAKVKDLGGDYSSVSAALTWAASEPGVIILNKAFDNIVTDGLVLNVDASNISSFTDSEPTTNYVNNTPSQGGWGGGYDVIDSSRKTFRFNINNFSGVAGSGQGWRSFTWNLNAYSGQAVTISAIVEVPDSSPGTFAWMMVGQTNTHTNNGSGAGTYLGYSTAGERVQKTTSTKERITWSGTLGSTGIASQPSGHVGFTVWYNGGTSGVNSYIIVSDVQIELHASATPFVDGTRSQNTSLYDLSNSDNHGVLTNGPTFNSNGWINFDGTQTSDYQIAVPINRAQLGNTMGIEATFKYEGSHGDGYRPIIGGNDPGRGTEFFLGKNTGNNRFGVQDGNYSGSFVSNYDVFDGRWHHMLYTYENGTGKLYLDGVLRNTGSFSKANDSEQIYIGAEVQEGYWWNGNISQIKYYTQALDATLNKQNYYQAPIVTDGLVFAIDAGNLVSYENGSVTAYNLAGSETGTLTNGVGFDKGNGGSIVFDGVDDYISKTRKQYTNEPWSVDIIFKPTDDNDTFWNGLFGGDLGGGGYWFFHNGGKLAFYNAVGYITYRTWTKANTFTSGTFHQLTITYVSTGPLTGDFILYYNGGEKTDSFSFTFANSFTLDSKYIGMGGGNRFGTNDVAVYREYEKALTAEEVQQNFNAQRNRFGI